MAEEFTKIESLLEQVKAYVNTRIDRFKLSLAEKTSSIIAMLAAGVVAILVFVFFLVFGGIAAALALGQWTGHNWLGFLIMAVVYLLLAVFVWVGRRRLIQVPVMNAMIRNLFNDEEEEDDHEKD
jgi:uncharacterized membrane protein YbhN (UPF0104 family)